MTVSRNVQYVAITTLKPYARNPRTHSKKQIRQIADSIERFGWTYPLLVDADLNVIAGHGRLEAARLLGLTEVPTLQLDHMSAADRRAYIIADNKLAENADWDESLLAVELEGILELDADFDLELIGFETAELDTILVPPAIAEETAPVEPDQSKPAVSRMGDLWFIGPHRLYVGDSLVRESWNALLGSERAQMVFTDPPYNVRVNGHVSGLGQTKHREFAMASGEMSPPEFTAFLREAFQRLTEFSVNGSIHFVCMDWRHMHEVLAAAEGVFDEFKNLCVWAKTNAGMGSFYRSQHELVFAFKNGSAPHINNFGLGETGRHRSNLWTYAGANTFREGRMEDLHAHPTVKPVQLVQDAIVDCSNRGDLIVDAFAGSGTTLLAAARAGRIGAGIELDPQYADLVLRRLQEQTGEPAIHADELESFAVVSELRSAEKADG